MVVKNGQWMVSGYFIKQAAIAHQLRDGGSAGSSTSATGATASLNRSGWLVSCCAAAALFFEVANAGSASVTGGLLSAESEGA
jgi:hypothetical protein